MCVTDRMLLQKTLRCLPYCTAARHSCDVQTLVQWHSSRVGRVGEVQGNKRRKIGKGTEGWICPGAPRVPSYATASVQRTK